MTTISIAMATYNGARFIREQLDSLAAQTYPPHELVVTDDGSSDRTLEIVADFSRSAPFPVHVYRNNPRVNYRANFMKCASLCSGDLIAFCDQDDIWDQDKLAVLVQHFKEVEADLVFHDFRLIDTDGNRIENVLSDEFPLSVDPWTVIRGLTLAFKRKLLGYSDLWALSIDQNNPSEHLAHDQWFVFLAYSFNSIHHISQPLLSYRQHASNLYGIADNSVDLETGLTGNLTALIQAIFGRPDLVQAKRAFLYKELLSRGLASKSRGEVLKEIYQREKSSCEDHFRRQIEQYRTLERLYIPRASIYKDEKTSTRLSCFFSALKNGSYDFNVRGLRNILLDLTYGVVLGPSKKLEFMNTT